MMSVSLRAIVHPVAQSALAISMLVGAWTTLSALPASAQELANAKVDVTLDAHLWLEHTEEALTFSCTGTPTCRTTWPISTNCPDGGTVSYTMTGLNLGQSGPVSGSITHLAAFQTQFDGVCSSKLVTNVYSYTGNWNAATSTGTMSINSWTYTTSQLGTTTEGCAAPNACPPFTGSFKLASAPTLITPTPVFPMVVTSNITATTATATAAIQFRPQDVGTNASIFSFAVAPRSLVKAAVMGEPPYVVGKALVLSGDKDTPADCVLAQLNSSGQLIAVTSAQLQAYSSGTLSAQGASVTILNNASTPAVAGATFYVGYGATSTTMLNNGVFRNAVTVPGTSVCPMLSSQTALWWNPAESGWGLNLNHQGNILFGTLFTYETGRIPMWLVMSNGAMQSDGLTFTGDLYRTTGPAFNANPFTPIGAANLTKVGTMTVAFQDVNSGTLSYTVNGTQVSKGIERQVFGTRAAACFPSTDSRASATNYQDLWWNAAESGWGINITHQDNILFATLFTYDATGKGLWLVMSAGTKQADGSYLGDLYQTAGPVFNASSFTGVTVATVGSMRLRFSDGNNGTLTYSYNGATITKAITRQLFSSPVPACN